MFTTSITDPLHLARSTDSEPAQDVCALAKAVIQIEAEAVAALHDRINASFTKACDIILRCQGRVVTLGIGKSGHVAKKIAATLSSTGTPAFPLHAAEANHGDLGMLISSDVLLIVSYSGQTPEVMQLIPVIQTRQVPIITITGDPHSNIATASNVVLNVQVQQEACPLNLAPTASTTASLVMGDALAMSLAQIRGYKTVDFARNHPGGHLGQHLSKN